MKENINIQVLEKEYNNLLKDIKKALNNFEEKCYKNENYSTDIVRKIEDKYIKYIYNITNYEYSEKFRKVLTDFEVKCL